VNDDLFEDTWLELSDERKAVLAPKLQAFLRDLASLAALEPAVFSDSEPVTTDWLVRSVGRARR
jgi:hypothetical protein